MSKSTKADKALLAKYADQVAAFRRFCIEHGDGEEFEEANFYDLSAGFFIAIGVNGAGPENEPFYDAFRLASICRYQLQYWEGEKL